MPEHQNYSLLLEFDRGLYLFLPRVFHKVRQGVNLVMIAPFTLVTCCGGELQILPFFSDLLAKNIKDAVVLYLTAWVLNGSRD